VFGRLGRSEVQAESGIQTVKVHYWDASAMVKLVAEDAGEETGRAELRAFFLGNSLHYATPACMAEALGVFKRKWLSEKVYALSDYVRTVREFYRLVVSGIALDEVPVSSQVLDQAERLVRQYELDFLDAIQVVTVLHGKYSVLVGESRSAFITADRRLARAALREGVRVLPLGRRGTSPQAS
jgi:predicted nucleic acid-binding protein